jgi:hypothetical protein
MNIVEMVNQFLTGDVLARLGNLIGEDTDKTRAAAGAAVPALLAGMSQAANTGDGARRLADAVNQMDDNVLGNLSGMFGGAQGGSTIDRGRDLLGSLMGGNWLSSIGNVLGRFTGVGGGSMLGLLGGIAPLVLGVLKRAMGSGSLDAGALKGLLADQRQNIAAAMPQGLTSALSGVPGMGDLSGFARGAAASAKDTARRAADYADNAARDAYDGAARAKGSLVPWVAAVLGLALLGWIVWALATRGGGPDATARDAMPSQPRVPAPATSPVDSLAGQAVTAGASLSGAASEQVTRVTRDLSEWVTSTTQTLTNITDASSADAALPKLRELSTKLDGVAGVVNALPLDAQRSIASVIQPSMAKVKDLVNKAMSVPGVSERIRPVLEPMMQKLQSLANG